jgi:hypothetical protein
MLCAVTTPISPAVSTTALLIFGAALLFPAVCRLQELDLSNNQLSNLPAQMGLMGPTLRVLMLDGNCIRAIRRPVLEKGTAAVLEWLKDRIPM